MKNLKAFDEAIARAEDEAMEKNNVVHEQNRKLLEEDSSAITFAATWEVWVIQNPEDPRNTEVMVSQGRPQSEWATGQAYARMRLEKFLEEGQQ